MGKVELTLQEYNDLVEATALALNEKLTLKKQLMEQQQKYIDLVGQFIVSKTYVWTHRFDKSVEITNSNLDEYISADIWSDTKFAREEILYAVRGLHYAKFN